ncbi:MAG: hypothetical protein ACK4F4_07320 [Hylemonella sp.]|uniref:hypothetical protein n=1 Tax=Hylemonella sp. TaxID=2066020 RepID=UPI00391C5D47
MATFPTYVKLGWRDSGETHRPIVDRVDMDRGIPKQRVNASDVLVTVPLTLMFDSASDADDFEDWFYTEGMAWFDFTLPRNGTVVQARIVGGDIGTLVPKRGDWVYSQRQVKLEYVRPVL